MKFAAQVQVHLVVCIEHTDIVLQLPTCHCGIGENEKVDALVKVGNRMEQCSHQVSYMEAKTILRNRYDQMCAKRQQTGSNPSVTEEATTGPVRIKNQSLQAGESSQLTLDLTYR